MRGEGLCPSRLVEKWLETGDDSILDVFKAGDEDFAHRSLPPRPLVHEDQEACATHLHLHWVCDKAGVFWNRYCVHLSEIEIPSEREVERRAVYSRDGDTYVPSEAERQVSGTVLVSIAQRVEDVKRVIVTRGLRAAVRLQSIDECTRRLWNPSQQAAPHSEVLVTVFEDGEGSSGACTSRIPGAGQPTNEIVERRAEVVKKVPHDDAEINRWVRLLAVEDEPMLGLLSVHFSEQAWSRVFYELGDFTVECLEMYLSPVDFGVNALHPREGTRYEHG